MSLLNSLIPEPYGILIRIGLLVLLTGGAFGVGYMKGLNHEKTIVQTQVIKEQAKTITLYKTQTVIDTTTVTKLQKTVDDLRSRNEQLSTHVKNLPVNQCTRSGNLTADWVNDYNKSIHLSSTLQTNK
jgi:hypothetical protein